MYTKKACKSSNFFIWVYLSGSNQIKSVQTSSSQVQQLLELVNLLFLRLTFFYRFKLRIHVEFRWAMGDLLNALSFLNLFIKKMRPLLFPYLPFPFPLPLLPGTLKDLLDIVSGLWLCYSFPGKKRD